MTSLVGQTLTPENFYPGIRVRFRDTDEFGDEVYQLHDINQDKAYEGFWYAGDPEAHKKPNGFYLDRFVIVEDPEPEIRIELGTPSKFAAKVAEIHSGRSYTVLEEGAKFEPLVPALPGCCSFQAYWTTGVREELVGYLSDSNPGSTPESRLTCHTCGCYLDDANRARRDDGKYRDDAFGNPWCKTCTDEHDNVDWCEVADRITKAVADTGDPEVEA